MPLGGRVGGLVWLGGMKAMRGQEMLEAGADRCVKCGLCLPHCPTWRTLRRESDSPRGRIELMAALAAGCLEDEAAVRTHLDGCLLCRACETACPAHVPFGALMDQARRRWRSGQAWQARLFASASGLRRTLLRWGLWLAVASGLARLAGLRAPKRWRMLPGMLPDAIALRRRTSVGQGAAAVGLFPGCVSDVVDRATLNDAATLVEHGGGRVAWLGRAGCCGALDRHQGCTARADAQLRRNLKAVPPSLEHLVSVATGCAAELQDYASLSDDPRARGLAARHCEIMAFLHRREEAYAFRPLERTVLLHHPCSARHALRETRSAAHMLRKIPGLRVIETSRAACCGAAGATMFRTPQMAAALAEGVVKECRDSGAHILATSNIGCALHLRQALRRRGVAAVVQHPVNLLAAQLKGESCAD